MDATWNVTEKREINAGTKKKPTHIDTHSHIPYAVTLNLTPSHAHNSGQKTGDNLCRQHGHSYPPETQHLLQNK